MIRHASRPLFALAAVIAAALAPAIAEAQTWSQHVTAGGGPVSPGGAYPSVAVDQANRRAIAYGGIPHVPDVWILENVDAAGGPPTWHALATSGVQPTTRHAHGMAYDAASNRLMVFGGCAGGCLPTLNDVWVLTNANGAGGPAQWMQLFPAGAAPAGRAHPGVVYDAATNRLIVFGGQNGSGFGGATFADVWVLTNANGVGGASAWQPLSPAGGPPPGQYGPAATYDSTLNRLTVFGGGAQGTGDPTNAVWDLDHANGLGGTPTWSNVIAEAAAGSPPPTAFARAAYDPANNRTLYLGTTPDVWVLLRSGSGATWKQFPASGPPPSPLALLAYTPATARLTVFELSPDFVWTLPVPAKPILTLKVNGLHPSPPVVTTTGMVRLTLDVSPSTHVGELAWYWLVVINGQPVWVTGSGLSLDPSPLAVLAPSPLTNQLLFESHLPAGTTITNVLMMIDGASIVAHDVITARVSGSS
jgi:hypothetical protein